MGITNLLGLGAIGPWTAYTPSWLGSTTNPVINNGTIAAYYCQTGKIVFFRGVITAGSTTTFGSGNYLISLPVPALVSAYQPIAQAIFTDTSAATNYYGNGDTNSSANNMSLRVSNVGATYPTNTAVTTAVPFTWATTDIIQWNGFYEAA
jgi:hypothetical protein